MRHRMLVRLAAVLVVLANGVWPHPVKKPEAGISSRVFHGKIPARGQFKSLVAFRIPSPAADPYCTGSIISNNYVLSARHCFEFLLHLIDHISTKVLNEIKYIIVITGLAPKMAKSPDFKETREVQVRKMFFFYIPFLTVVDPWSHDCDNVNPVCFGGKGVCDAIVCEANAATTCPNMGKCKELSEDKTGDNSVGKVDKPFIFNDFVDSLPFLGYWDSASLDCIAVGYGENKLDAPNFLDGLEVELFYADVTAGGKEYCMFLFNWSTFSISRVERMKCDFEKAICSTGPKAEKQICNGDSGVPLICKFKSRDVVVGELRNAHGYGTFKDWDNSANKPCGHDKKVAIYASTGSYMNWIVSATQGQVNFIDTASPPEINISNSNDPPLSDLSWLGNCMLLMLWLGVTMLLLN